MDEEKEDLEADGEKLVAFKLLQKLGDNEAGEVIHVPEEVGKALCEAGHAEYAKAEDMNQGVEDMEDEKEYDDEPMVANAAGKLTKKMAEAVSKAMPLIKNDSHSVPAMLAKPIFKSNGEYIASICRAVATDDKSAATWNRINAYQQKAADNWNKLGVQTKAILGVNETTTTQGGFLVNPEFSPDVYVIPHGQIDLQKMCPAIDAKSNLLNYRYVNESNLANGSIFGGLNMVATSEGASFTSSLPAWSNLAFQLVKFAVFVYYTSEILQDASYPIERELDEYVLKTFVFGLNTQIIQGTSIEGVLNSPGLVTVTHSANDVAWHTTPSENVTYSDIASIWSAVYPDCQASSGGVWLFHPSLTNPLVQMSYTFNGATPAFGITYNVEDGTSGADNFPGATMRLFGKPAYPCWACSAPGVAGDLMYVDFNTFRLYRKPYRVEVSKDYQFGVDQIAVRFVSRLDCKTLFRNAVTGVNGTESFSACVTRSSVGT